MATHPKNQLGQFIPKHYQYQMLSDENRMKAFKAAIERVVKPHHNVVELGSGTGVLSFFAAKQGASVQSIEYNPELFEISRGFLKQNGVHNKVEVNEGDASDWMPSNPVDVVICEMLHSALLIEKQVEVVESFREKHRKKFGTTPIMIPSATLLALQPVLQDYSFEGYYAQVPFFQSPYTVSNNTNEVIEPSVYQIIDYDNASVEKHTCYVSYNFEEDTEFNAFRFITKNVLEANTPGGDIIDWHNHHLIIPTPDTVSVKAGQNMYITFSYTAGDSINVLSDTMEVTIE